MAPLMFWFKTLLWLAVVLLPGGLLLLPALYALHRRESAATPSPATAELVPVGALADELAP